MSLKSTSMWQKIVALTNVLLIAIISYEYKTSKIHFHLWLKSELKKIYEYVCINEILCLIRFFFILKFS